MARRIQTDVRLGQRGRDLIDQTALAEGVVRRDGGPNRSEMVRIMLAYAIKHRPKGWRP